MLYWLIPYLVAFNSTGSENWTHGPEYLFKADMETDIQLENNITAMTKIDINFSCRPLNESSIRCRVVSAEMENTQIDGNDANEEKKELKRDIDIANWAFEVQFDRNGVHSIALLNNEKADFRYKIIRAIFNTIDIGSDFVSEVKIGRTLLSNEVSLIGVCDASVSAMTMSESSKAPGTPVTFYMDVPSFTERSENETLIIGKERYLDHCSDKTPYFFSSHGGSDDNVDYNVTVSEAGVYFGRHHFGGTTANLGTLTGKIKNPEQPGTTQLIHGNAKETIHLGLEAIRGATEKL